MANLVLGIDLGTTNSAAAIVKDGRLQAIQGRDGKKIIPSVLNIDPTGQLIVGQQAKRRSITHPEGTIYGAKRLMGRLFGTREMQEIKARVYYNVIEGEQHEPLILAGDRALTLEEIGSLILAEVKSCAQDYLQQNIEQAVISVPAYFTQRQRQSIREAGRLAGLNVLRVVNEPTAAALAAGIRHKWGKQRVLIFDLGGGTFDVSILQIKNRVFEVIGTCGNSFLGGIDFDNVLIDRLCEQAIYEIGVDIRNNPVALQRLRDAAEHARIQLSTAGRTHICLPYLVEDNGVGIDFEQTLTRAALEEMSVPLVQETLKYVQRALFESKLDKKDIDQVVLVGGMTRMPLIQKTVAAFFGKPPCTDVDPDLSVAYGAAILAQAIGSGQGEKLLQDILSVSVGLALPDGKFEKVIAKNAKLPVQKTLQFKTTKDFQDHMLLRLFQGESRLVENNDFLGQMTITGIPLLPKGQAKIDITFSIDTDSILHVTATEPGSGRQFKATLITDGSAHRSDMGICQQNLGAAPIGERKFQGRSPKNR